MELLEAIYNRRSIRKFSDKKIPDKMLKKIINACTQAPSACDIQGWKFIVVYSKKIIQKIIDKGAASFIKNAPVNIFVLYDNRTENVEYKDFIQSAAACIQNMILLAHSFNIGCCWVCHLPLKRQLRKILKIPPHYDPIACVALGYYKERPKYVRRKYRLDEIVSYNKFAFKEKRAGSYIKLILRRTGRRAYYYLPFRKWIKPFIDKKFEKKFD